VKILAIGAHPDDIELGCGGMLVRAARMGHQVYMCTVTKGAASGDPTERTQELFRSAKFVGAKDVMIGDFQDTRLSVDSQLINFLESYIDKVDPDVVMTHFHGDIHHDHRAVSIATQEAARFSSNILAYEIPLTRNFDPKVYYDISDVIDDKIELIRIYWSQRSKLYTKANAIKALAEFRALQSRLNTSISYVEAFDTLKLCLNNEFKLMKVPHDKTREAKESSRLIPHEELEAVIRERKMDATRLG
jgi:LmbE family N-acetylglucosaminyl deacetylase